jgi:hypothetical protein
MIKNKIIGTLILAMLSACSQAQELRIVVVGEELLESPLKLYSASIKDTVELKQFDSLIFRVNDRFFENHVIVRYKSSVFNLGEVHSLAKSIVLKLSPTASNDCYVIHRIYGDVIQSDLQHITGCDVFHEISIYDDSNPEIGKNSTIKLRKKNNPTGAHLPTGAHFPLALTCPRL